MFTPHSPAEKQEMLKAVGIERIEELFNDVPAEFRFPKLDLPAPLSEMEALRNVHAIASKNRSTDDLICFLGAGSYKHYIPAAIDGLIARNEFYTAYTPYQPEISQGTLQAVFEYQSLMAALTGMEVCNASHYDGATAVAEAGVMAHHHFRGTRPQILYAPSVHPQYIETLRTYMSGNKDIRILSGSDDGDAFLRPEGLIPELNDKTSLVIVQYPDFFGRLFDLSTLAQAVHAVGALFCVAINPIALGLFKAPGEYGADIVVGEGQPLGIPLSFGGPYLGIFATRKELVRKISGRLVGETVDGKGKKGYVLTLAVREQHIKREKATSNICTNEGLMALAASIYISLLGKQGLKQVAELCYRKAHYACGLIAQLKGFTTLADVPFFNEFVVKCPTSVKDINNNLLKNGVLGGFDLGSYYPELKNHMLLAVTEMNTREDIDLLVSILKGDKP
jgi:glycine dehydrogenase subunit 1